MTIPPFKDVESNTVRSATHDFLLVMYSNCGPITYRFRDKRRFQSITANFLAPVFNAVVEGVKYRGTSNFVTAFWLKGVPCSDGEKV